MAVAWKVTETIPDDVRLIKYDTELDNDRKQAFDRTTLNDRINKHVTFIAKDNKLIYPELKINQRLISEAKPKSTGDKAPPKKIFSDIDLQTWNYNKVR